MKPFDPGNDWLKFWNENQKSLFQAWAEGKPPPFAFRGEPPPSGDSSRQSDLMSDLMRRSMEEWAEYAKKAWTQGDRFDAESVKHLFDPAEWKRAGSQFVIHTHGELLKARCLICTHVSDRFDDISEATACPICGNVGHLRPHIVWVGDEPLRIASVYQALAHAALFLAIGANVGNEPAHSFLAEARRAGDDDRLGLLAVFRQRCDACST